MTFSQVPATVLGWHGVADYGGEGKTRSLSKGGEGREREGWGERREISKVRASI